MNTKFLFTLLAIAIVGSGAYGQNTCATATPVSLSSGTVFINGSTTGVANDNAASGAGFCQTSVGTAGQKWYSLTWNACSTALVSVSTDYATTNYDTKLHVYTGNCGNLTCVAGDDDGGIAFNLTSIVSFNAVPGTTYLIRVGGYNTSVGNFQVAFSAGYGGCKDPSACNYDMDATFDNCSCVPGSEVALYHIDSDGNSPGKWMYLMDGESMGQSAGSGEGIFRCLEDPCHMTIGFFNGTSDTWAGHSWLITFEGQAYTGNAPNAGSGWSYIQVDFPFCGCTDPAALNFDAAAAVDDGSCHYPEPNTNCALAQLILLNSVLELTNEYQSTETTLISCGGSQEIKDLWYSFTYSGAKLILRANPGTLSDTRLAVYESCNSTPIACNDDSGLGTQSELILNCEDGLVPGQMYYLQVGGFNTMAGTFELVITWNYEYGCMDPNAVNYDPCANQWDGTCYYCAADLNLDGVVGISDLLLFTSQYGSDCSPN